LSISRDLEDAIEVVAASFTMAMMLKTRAVIFVACRGIIECVVLYQKGALNTKDAECRMPTRLPLVTQHHQTNMLATLVSTINREFKVETSIFLFLPGAVLLHMLMQPTNPQLSINRLDNPFPISIGTIKQAYHSAPTQQLGKMPQSGFSPGSS
jgi:hypothetical protein